MLTRTPRTPRAYSPIIPLWQDWMENTGFATGPTQGQIAWPSANRAYYVPWRVKADCSVLSLSYYCNTRTSGNHDLGLYDAAGNRVGSSGATAIVAAAVNTWTPAAPIGVSAGDLLYVAMMVTSTNPTILCTTASVGATGDAYRMSGVLQEATGGTLPNPATFAAASSSNYCPLVAVNLAGMPT